MPLLGAIPLQKPLTAPNLSQVVDEISGRWLNGRAQGLNERVLRIVIGAMTAKGMMDYLQPGVLILTPGDRDDITLPPPLPRRDSRAKKWSRASF